MKSRGLLSGLVRWRAAPAVTCLTTWMVVSACGGADSTGVGRSNGTGGGSGSGGAVSSGGAAGSGGVSAGGVVGSGGAAGSGGSGGVPICPPCAAPPWPDCVGTGPCGCGPYVCPDAGGGSCGGVECGPGSVCCGPPECGQCVPAGSGVFCPDYCVYCSGTFRRTTGTAVCSGGRTTLWEAAGGDLTVFAVPVCQDLGTNLPRFCCIPDFVPACP